VENGVGEDGVGSCLRYFNYSLGWDGGVFRMRGAVVPLICKEENSTNSYSIFTVGVEERAISLSYSLTVQCWLFLRCLRSSFCRLLEARFPLKVAECLLLLARLLTRLPLPLHGLLQYSCPLSHKRQM
jgi:hypothetical protein